jgi:probable F420-dependent oxidoreductase
MSGSAKGDAVGTIKLGAYFPLREVGLDFSLVPSYLKATEDAGFSHVRFGVHDIGAGMDSRPEWTGRYDSNMPWHEPFVLFGWMSHFTEKLEFTTGTLTLPQRQTALVAKQAAQVDRFMNGRFRLGVAVGWNSVEFEALGMDFANRGQRLEEQIEVLRLLWTQPLVNFTGKWHTLNNVGINPLPQQRPIPIWIGGGPGSPVPVGTSGTTATAAKPTPDRVMRRIARLADGWLAGPDFEPDDRGHQIIEGLRQQIRESGREESAVGIEGSITLHKAPTAAHWKDLAKRWKDVGCTHLAFNTIKAGLKTFDEHTAKLREFRDAVGSIL